MPHYLIEKIGRNDEFWVVKEKCGIVHIFNRIHGLLYAKYSGETLAGIKGCGHMCGFRQNIKTCCQCRGNHQDVYCKICVER